MADRINIVELREISDSESGWFHDGIRQDLAPIETEDKDLARQIIELIHSKSLSGAPIALAGGHAYERKGYLAVDQLGGPRNTAYGSKTDDVILQISVRVDYRDAQEIVAAVAEEQIAKKEAEAIAARARIDAEIARLQAERDAI